MSDPVAEQRFYGFGVAPPEGEWAYVLDEAEIVYGDLVWPFAIVDEPAKRIHLERVLQRSGKREGFTYVPPAEGTGFATIRLSPNTEYRSWGNEYVMVWPSRDNPSTATADADLWVRRQGMGGMVVGVSITIDLIARTATIDELPPVPAEYLPQAEEKAAKILAFLVAAMEERDRDVKRPRTAYDDWDGI